MEKMILKFIKEQLELDESLELVDRFKELSEWDSLATLSLMSMIDEKYDVIIGQEDLETMVTIQDVVEFIKQNKEV